MKIGFGLYRHMLTRDNLQFARQAGATHIVVHLVDYFNQGEGNSRKNQPIGDSGGWGFAGDPDKIWTLDELQALRRQVNAEGLALEALENFDPAHWYDVLLDGPRKGAQLEGLKTIIRNMGKAGIPVMGYNFSIAGVCSRITGPFARGNAESVGMEGVDDTPIPNGMVWNMVYDPDAPAGTLPGISHEELWQRLAVFLEEMVPVAEECGVKLAAHPDDPPVPVARGVPKLVYQPRMYQRLLDMKKSPASGLEFCCGTIAEMTEGDLYEAVDTYSRQGKIFYVHFRNIRGKVPNYQETFIDEGDIDMVQVLRILRKNGFEGMLIPDHTPLMTCDAPWHAGMAYALGYIRAAKHIIEAE